jgi:hypothetical protein
MVAMNTSKRFPLRAGLLALGLLGALVPGARAQCDDDYSYDDTAWCEPAGEEIAICYLNDPIYWAEPPCTEEPPVCTGPGDDYDDLNAYYDLIAAIIEQMLHDAEMVNPPDDGRIYYPIDPVPDRNLNLN